MCIIVKSVTFTQHDQFDKRFKCTNLGFKVGEI